MITAIEAPQTESAVDVLLPAPQGARLTQMQVGILARGMNEKLFALTKAETGKSSGFLVARGLIKSIRKGVYTLTDAGRGAYTNILSGHTAALDISAPQIDAATGLNLNDEALHETETARWKRIADERLKTLRYAETTIDELGRLIDVRDTDIKRLNGLIDQRDIKIEAQRRQIDVQRNRLKEQLR